MPPIPPLKLYEAARLMDSFEKPNILAGIQTTADEIKSGQKEAAIPRSVKSNSRRKNIRPS